MIATGKKNLFVQHYDKIVAVVGGLAFIGGMFLMMDAMSVSAEDSAEEKRLELKGPNTEETGVAPADMLHLNEVSALVKTPPSVKELSPAGKASFLSSESRVFCANEKCQAPIVIGLDVCPVCKTEQPKAKKVTVVLDTDSDGVPDEVEKKYGMNPNENDVNTDLDGDLFTNGEEIAAGTNPADPKSHPPYIDCVTLQLPLKETKLPFYFKSAMPIPSGYRLEFYNAKGNALDTRTRGETYRVLVGEEIGKTGFIVKAYEPKTEKRAVKGGKGMVKSVDVSTATVVRKSDKRELVLTVGDRRLQSVDVQAVLVFNRLTPREFVVVPGDSIDLNGEKWLVKRIDSEDKTVKVLLESAMLGTKKVIQAIAQ